MAAGEAAVDAPAGEADQMEPGSYRTEKTRIFWYATGGAVKIAKLVNITPISPRLIDVYRWYVYKWWGLETNL